MFPQNNERNHRVFQRAFITIALSGDCPITNDYTSDTLTNILSAKEMVLLEHFIDCTWYTFSWSQQWKKVIRPWFPVFSFYNVYSHFARHFLIYPHFVQKVKSLITVTWLQKIINLLQIPCLHCSVPTYFYSTMLLNVEVVLIFKQFELNTEADSGRDEEIHPSILPRII